VASGRKEEKWKLGAGEGEILEGTEAKLVFVKKDEESYYILSPRSSGT
jgi:hypothetical protein